MKKIDVILFGTRPLSVFVYNLICSSKKLNLKGIITIKPKKKSFWKEDLFYIKKRKFFPLQVKNLKFDLGICINWEKKISKQY